MVKNTAKYGVVLEIPYGEPVPAEFERRGNVYYGEGDFYGFPLERDALFLVSIAIDHGFTGVGGRQHGDLARRFLHLDDLENAPGQPRKLSIESFLGSMTSSISCMRRMVSLRATTIFW